MGELLNSGHTPILFLDKQVRNSQTIDREIDFTENALLAKTVPTVEPQRTTLSVNLNSLSSDALTGKASTIDEIRERYPRTLSSTIGIDGLFLNREKPLDVQFYEEVQSSGTHTCERCGGSIYRYGVLDHVGTARVRQKHQGLCPRCTEEMDTKYRNIEDKTLVLRQFYN